VTVDHDDVEQVSKQLVQSLRRHSARPRTAYQAAAFYETNKDMNQRRSDRPSVGETQTLTSCSTRRADSGRSLATRKKPCLGAKGDRPFLKKDQIAG